MSKKKCPYCESDEPEALLKDPYNVLILRDNHLYFFSSEGEDDYVLFGKINFCPMCRRKLRREGNNESNGT